jgi:hypothetical protein
MMVRKGHQVIKLLPISADKETTHKSILIHNREPYDPTTNIYHLYTDNQATEHIATQPTMNEHSRAIDTRHHAIRQDYIENSMRIRGVSSSENTSDILTKNLQPHLHQKHCAALHILQPMLTQSNMNLTDDSRQSSGGEEMSHVLNDTNLKKFGLEPLTNTSKKDPRYEGPHDDKNDSNDVAVARDRPIRPTSSS